MTVLFGHTETPTAPHQAVAANNLAHQGVSAIPETPETEQQHILDDVMTSGSENGKKSRKGRISECLTVYHFTVIHVVKVSDFFPRKSRCTSSSIWSPTTSLEKVWRYEKLVFQANQCCFRDVENPRDQFFFLLIEGFQIQHMDLM